ncbi:MAG TPA: ion transporter [Gammaproteobacteria bacterium]|jgi:voltage-gated potassium channel|nr:ion transporter [Gammaproteobacteria bacterium]MDP6732434.1 ion transporter [Gammaproteobacteria bacterium]HAJ76171.1 ion transporter [Gammaproteobacteria bacterium]
MKSSIERNLKQQVNDVIFGYESRAGKLFDVVLIFMIVISVSAVLFDSVDSYHDRYGEILLQLEWFFTILFTIEYILRLYSTENLKRYVFSFYGLIDLFSILPTYIALIFPIAQPLIVIRIMRVLRIFRILKLFRYMGEANLLYTALIQARRKIFVFLFTVFTLIVIFGALMFIIEGPENGFNSIPESIYWAIVTITTVGYGDTSPQTPVGQFVAALAMICGYAIIAVPTGIIGAELMNEFQHRSRSATVDKRKCVSCKATGHDLDARYCKYCGNLIHTD